MCVNGGFLLFFGCNFLLLEISGDLNTSLGRDHSLWSDVFSGKYPKHHVLKFDGWPARNKYGVWPICYCIYEVGIKSCMDLRERCFDSGLIPIPGPLSHVIPCAAGWCSRDRPCRRHSTVVACCWARTCLWQDPLSLRIFCGAVPLNKIGCFARVAASCSMIVAVQSLIVLWVRCLIFKPPVPTAQHCDALFMVHVMALMLIWQSAS